MGARHPVIFTEAAGKEPDAVDALVELVELLALPVVEAAAPACTNFPTDHPPSRILPQPFLNEADVILLVESATPWHPPSKGPRVQLQGHLHQPGPRPGPPTLTLAIRVISRSTVQPPQI